ncbi:hypothetical protein MF672_017310 [Actinomadura sp. ATCC 31491]|uniref:SRPBCC family protein n=1 Tax=Actinomadura luzonensis TaxID=2805427 RepID=A0ABT0FT55_9ACTN|nr:hypothetical protein [Actinomadura luzonensis]MCK2215531.1 hypothetical protein [Actinomadura luzonensis]
MPTATTWGTNASERATPYPCDDLVPNPAESWFRAVTIRAPRPIVFRWLCQLRAAPYSYDLLDNLGRRSPRTLTPGLDRLAVGQRFMTIFELATFTPDEQLTLRLTSPSALRAFGPLTLTYAVRDAPAAAAAESRLVVKLNLGEPGDGPLHHIRRRALAWGDLFMMQRQLHTLRLLAESTPPIQAREIMHAYETRRQHPN